MSDLDKKLDEIIEEAQGYIDDDDIKQEARNKAKAEIKQVLADEESQQQKAFIKAVNDANACGYIGSDGKWHHKTTERLERVGNIGEGQETSAKMSDRFLNSNILQERLER